MNWFRRLRAEWTKNDGKPREDRVQGHDLKEMVLVILLVISTSVLIALVIRGMFRR